MIDKTIDLYGEKKKMFDILGVPKQVGMVVLDVYIDNDSAQFSGESRVTLERNTTGNMFYRFLVDDIECIASNYIDWDEDDDDAEDLWAEAHSMCVCYFKYNDKGYCVDYGSELREMTKEEEERFGF